MNKWIINLLGVAVVVFAGIYIYLNVITDHDAPKITIPNTSVTYREGEDTKVLLEGVTAIDEEDGDVSDSLMIASVYPSLDNSQARVVYIARDKSNNMTSLDRFVDYVEQQSDNPEEGQEFNEDMPYEEGTGDGTMQNVPQQLSPEEELAAAQAAAEQAFAALPADAPRLTMSAQTVTIGLGEEFSKLQYVHEITDNKDTREQLFQRVQINGDVNTEQPGVYQLGYVVVDSDGNRSNEATLTVVVAQ